MKCNSLTGETISIMRAQATHSSSMVVFGSGWHPTEVTFGTGTISAAVQRHLAKAGRPVRSGTVVLMGSSILPAVVRHIDSLR
jgi:predicted RecA/RadA family phage recombinase